MNDFFIILLVFFAGWFGTGIIRSYAEKTALLDIPNERSSHDTPTPRGGGLAVVLAFVTGLSCYFLTGRIALSNFGLFLFSILLVASISLIDDLRGVPSRWRLLTHFVAATVFVLPYMKDIEQFSVFSGLTGVGSLLGCTLTIVGLVWILNLFNFMDGIDGIAASEAIFISLGGAALLYYVGLHSYVLIFLLLASGCLGFIWWNWPPAKIFMGDVCSAFLGFTLGALAIHTVLMSPHVTIWPWLILFGVFIVDATYTLLVRFKKGDRWYEAHRSHAYQHAAIKFKSHRFVTISVLFINIIWLLPLAFLAIEKPHYGIHFTLIAYLPLIMISRALKAGKNF